MNQYIITEEQITELRYYEGFFSRISDILDVVHSNPYNSQAKIYATNEQLGRIMDEYEARKDEREKVLNQLGDLISQNSPWSEKDGLAMYAIPVWQLDRWLNQLRQEAQPR